MRSSKLWAIKRDWTGPLKPPRLAAGAISQQPDDGAKAWRGPGSESARAVMPAARGRTSAGPRLRPAIAPLIAERLVIVDILGRCGVIRTEGCYQAWHRCAASGPACWHPEGCYQAWLNSKTVEGRGGLEPPPSAL